jgi:YggT family protein
MTYILKDLIYLSFNIYRALLIIQIILSWVPHNRHHPLVKKLYSVTDPYLDVFRQLPLNFGGFDLSPIIGFLALDFIANIILSLF